MVSLQIKNAMDLKHTRIDLTLNQTKVKKMPKNKFTNYAKFIVSNPEEINNREVEIII